MKRMVENSEKIEEIADVMEIKNGELITSNITTPGGDKIPIFSDGEVDIFSTFPGSIFLSNLGTALLFEVTIHSGTANGNYPIARILRPEDEIAYVKISNGNEFNPNTASGDGPSDFVIKTEFNETLADHKRSNYKLILLIGKYSKES